MDTHFIFEQVKKMKPSSLSEEERQRYQEEKMLLRQFMLLKQQDQVPDSLTVRHMKTWLLTQRRFLDEFQEVIKKTGIDHLFMAELAWTTARHFCLNQMEEEVLEELDKEEQLSELFNRKVTLEGLHLLVSSLRPGAEEDVQSFLPSLHKRLLQTFLSVSMPCPLSAGDAKLVTLVELEQITAPLVPGVVGIALEFLLEEPEQGSKRKAASAEIGQLLTKSVAPWLACYEDVSHTLLLGVCSIVAALMVRAIFRRFEEQSQSFKGMDYDHSSIFIRAIVISAFKTMDQSEQTDPSRQDRLQLCPSAQEDSSLEAVSEEVEEELVEEREAFPQVSLPDVSEDTAKVDLNTIMDLSFLDDDLEEPRQEDSKEDEPLVQDSSIQDNHKEVQIASGPALPQDHTSDELENSFLEKRGIVFSEDLDEEMVPMPNNVTVHTDTIQAVAFHDEVVEMQQEKINDHEKDESLGQDSAVQGMDHEVQHTLSTQNRLLEKREASPQVTATEDLDNYHPEERREASALLSVDEATANIKSDPSMETSLVGLQSNVARYIDDELKVLQQQEVDAAEAQDALFQDCDRQKQKKKKKKEKLIKKRVKSFFCASWKKMTCCLHSSTED